MEHTHNTDWITVAVAEFEGPLLRYATRFTGNAEQARDAVQDTFLKLCRANREQIQDHLAPWLFTVCRNRMLERRRKENRMQTLTAPQLAVQESAEAPPDSHLARQDSRNRLLAHLETLPTREQEIVRLKFQNNLTYREIAEVLGLTTTNVGFILHTAMRKLRRQLRAEGEV